MASPVAWIEEQPSSQKSATDETSTDSNATVIETAVYQLQKKQQQEDQASLSEYSGDVTISADLQYEPLTTMTRDPYGIAASTASDPIPIDDLNSTSTVLTAATEDPRIYRETERQKEDEKRWTEALAQQQQNGTQQNVPYPTDRKITNLEIEVNLVRVQKPVEVSDSNTTVFHMGTKSQGNGQNYGQDGGQRSGFGQSQGVGQNYGQSQGSQINGQVTQFGQNQENQINGQGTQFGQRQGSQINEQGANQGTQNYDQQNDQGNVLKKPEEWIEVEATQKSTQSDQVQANLSANITTGFGSGTTPDSTTDASIQRPTDFGTLACELTRKEEGNGQDIPVQTFGGAPSTQANQEIPVQTFNGNAQSQFDQQNTDEHRVHFKAEEPKNPDNEWAPTISAIEFNEKPKDPVVEFDDKKKESERRLEDWIQRQDDVSQSWGQGNDGQQPTEPSTQANSSILRQLNTSTPEPQPGMEKRVSFSEQLVKKYPESPKDSKSFVVDAEKLVHGDAKKPTEDEKAGTETKWVEVQEPPKIDEKTVEKVDEKLEKLDEAVGVKKEDGQVTDALGQKIDASQETDVLGQKIDASQGTDALSQKIDASQGTDALGQGEKLIKSFEQESQKIDASQETNVSKPDQGADSLKLGQEADASKPAQGIEVFDTKPSELDWKPSDFKNDANQQPTEPSELKPIDLSNLTSTDTNQQPAESSDLNKVGQQITEPSELNKDKQQNNGLLDSKPTNLSNLTSTDAIQQPTEPSDLNKTDLPDSKPTEPSDQSTNLLDSKPAEPSDQSTNLLDSKTTEPSNQQSTLLESKPTEPSDQSSNLFDSKPTESSDQSTTNLLDSKPTEPSDQLSNLTDSKPTESSDQSSNLPDSKPTEPSDQQSNLPPETTSNIEIQIFKPTDSFDAANLNSKPEDTITDTSSQQILPDTLSQIDDSTTIASSGEETPEYEKLHRKLGDPQFGDRLVESLKLVSEGQGEKPGDNKIPESQEKVEDKIGEKVEESKVPEEKKIEEGQEKVGDKISESQDKIGEDQGKVPEEAKIEEIQGKVEDKIGDDQREILTKDENQGVPPGIISQADQTPENQLKQKEESQQIPSESISQNNQFLESQPEQKIEEQGVSSETIPKQEEKSPESGESQGVPPGIISQADYQPESPQKVTEPTDEIKWIEEQTKDEGQGKDLEKREAPEEKNSQDESVPEFKSGQDNVLEAKRDQDESVPEEKSTQEITPESVPESKLDQDNVFESVPEVTLGQDNVPEITSETQKSTAPDQYTDSEEPKTLVSDLEKYALSKGLPILESSDESKPKTSLEKDLDEWSARLNSLSDYARLGSQLGTQNEHLLCPILNDPCPGPAVKHFEGKDEDDDYRPSRERLGESSRYLRKDKEEVKEEQDPTNFKHHDLNVIQEEEEEPSRKNSGVEGKSTEPSEQEEKLTEPSRQDQKSAEPFEQKSSQPIDALEQDILEQQSASSQRSTETSEQQNRQDQKPSQPIDALEQDILEQQSASSQRSTEPSEQQSQVESKVSEPSEQQSQVESKVSEPSEQQSQQDAKPTESSDQSPKKERDSLISGFFEKPKVEETQWITQDADSSSAPKVVDVKNGGEDPSQTQWITQEPDSQDVSATKPSGHKDTTQWITEGDPKLDTKTNDNQPSTSQQENGSGVGQSSSGDKTELDQSQKPSSNTNMNDDEFDVYQKKLIQNTREALALVDKICQDSLEKQERRKRHLSGGPLSALDAERSGREYTPAENRPKIGEFDDLEVEVYRVNAEMMEEPKSCVLLPDAKLLLLDKSLGLTLMDLQSKETKRCAPADDWRDVECATYMKKHNQILLVYEQKVDDQFYKYLARFDLNLQMLTKCEAPKYLQDMVVSSCRVCYVDETDCIYLAVNTPNNCFIYELNADCKWTEVHCMRGKQVADIAKLATVGPVTELLVVESTKRHILLLSIYNSALAERALIAACAEPASLCTDEHDNLIVFDRATNLVGVHSRLNFERIKDLVVVGRAHCSLSAREGFLAVMNVVKKELRICKY